MKWLLVNNPAATMSSEQIMSLLREDINVPLDEVVEVHCPTGQYKVKYINMAEAANNADWIVRTSSLVDIDRQNVAEWVGRVRWLLGASSVESNSDRAVRTIKGRLLLHGHPVPFARVAMIGENAGFIGIGGGYRSYINGLDVVQGIYDLPENCYASVTAIDGTFQIPVRAGGPYEFVAFLVNSATTRMEGITIKSGVLKEDVPYKGWMVGDVETRDLGDLNCVIEHRKAKKLPRAEVYAYVDKEAYARGSLVEAHFRVRNAGEAELAIEKIVTSCSCSKIRLCDKGQKLDIQWPLHLNAKDGVVLCMTITTKASSRLGVQKKDFAVISNDPITPVLRKYVKFDLVEWVAVSPPFLRVEIKPGQDATKRVDLAGINGCPLPHISSVRLSDEKRVLPITLNEQLDGFTLTFGEQSFKNGETRWSERLTIKFVDPNCPSVIVPVSCHRANNVDIFPSMLQLGSMRKGTLIQRAFKVTGLSEKVVDSVESNTEEFEILRYTASNDMLNIELRLDEEQGKGQLHLCLSSGEVIEVEVQWR